VSLRILALALPLLASAAAHADAKCPGPSEVGLSHLLGFWRAEVAGRSPATLLLEPNKDYRESFSGAVNRNGERSLVAGDVDDGEFTLEESRDGVHIAAIWLGDVVEGSCGKEIRGTWQLDGDDAHRHEFVMKKMP
jgi:hypothetical protein